MALAKGKESLEARHFTNPTFLTCFAISIGIHTLNNSGISLGLPPLFGLLRVEYVIIQAIAIAIWFLVLKRGVNQVVQIALAHNKERLTMAVRGSGDSMPVNPGQAANLGNNVPLAAQPRQDGNGQASGACCLQGVAGEYSGRKIPLKPGMALRIGRDPQRASLSLPGSVRVSGLHCEVLFDGRDVLIRDLGSTNGTYIDGKRIPPQQGVKVPQGSKIYLGDGNCCFVIVK